MQCIKLGLGCDFSRTVKVNSMPDRANFNGPRKHFHWAQATALRAVCQSQERERYIKYFTKYLLQLHKNLLTYSSFITYLLFNNSLRWLFHKLSYLFKIQYYQ